MTNPECTAICISLDSKDTRCIGLNIHTSVSTDTLKSFQNEFESIRKEEQADTDYAKISIIKRILIQRFSDVNWELINMKYISVE